jgi:hypothetical protein
MVEVWMIDRSQIDQRRHRMDTAAVSLRSSASMTSPSVTHLRAQAAAYRGDGRQAMTDDPRHR